MCGINAMMVPQSRPRRPHEWRDNHGAPLIDDGASHRENEAATVGELRRCGAHLCAEAREITVQGPVIERTECDLDGIRPPHDAAG